MSSTSMCISEKLREIEQLFSKAGIPSPRLDTEVLLAHVLSVTRPYLHAHGEEKLGSEEVRKLGSYVERRLKREPVAYIVGKKEFYGREFMVTPDVLIPRPETEELIELVLESGSWEVGKLGSKKGQASEAPLSSTDGSKRAGNYAKVLDAGCGSGCIGITLKLERPGWNVTLADISSKALSVAKKNAKQLSADVQFAESDLLSNFLTSPLSTFDLIIANLPYVNKAWETSPETRYEPKLALYAEDNGLELIKKLIEQSSEVLNNQGLLLVEADPEQHPAIIEAATSCGFKLAETKGYALGFTKLTRA